MYNSLLVKKRRLISWHYVLQPVQFTKCYCIVLWSVFSSCQFNNLCLCLDGISHWLHVNCYNNHQKETNCQKKMRLVLLQMVTAFLLPEKDTEVFGYCSQLLLLLLFIPPMSDSTSWLMLHSASLIIMHKQTRLMISEQTHNKVELG